MKVRLLRWCIAAVGVSLSGCSVIGGKCLIGMSRSAYGKIRTELESENGERREEILRSVMWDVSSTPLRDRNWDLREGRIREEKSIREQCWPDVTRETVQLEVHFRSQSEEELIVVSSDEALAFLCKHTPFMAARKADGTEVRFERTHSNLRWARNANGYVKAKVEEYVISSESVCVSDWCNFMPSPDLSDAQLMMLDPNLAVEDRRVAVPVKELIKRCISESY